MDNAEIVKSYFDDEQNATVNVVKTSDSYFIELINREGCLIDIFELDDSEVEQYLN